MLVAVSQMTPEEPVVTRTTYTPPPPPPPLDPTATAPVF
jgi:hypothetical protein